GVFRIKRKRLFRFPLCTSQVASEETQKRQARMCRGKIRAQFCGLFKRFARFFAIAYSELRKPKKMPSFGTILTFLERSGENRDGLRITARLIQPDAAVNFVTGHRFLLRINWKRDA